MTYSNAFTNSNEANPFSEASSYSTTPDTPNMKVCYRVHFRGHVHYFVTSCSLWWRNVRPRPITKLAIRNFLINILAATFHIWRPLPPSATPGRAIPWWQVTHLIHSTSHILWNVRRIVNNKQNIKLKKEAVAIHFKVLSQHSSKGRQKQRSVSFLHSRILPRSSRVLSRNGNPFGM